MFRRDQARCAKLALSSPLGFYKVALFALVSAKVRFHDMPETYAAALRNPTANVLFGWKGPGADYLWRHREHLHRRFQRLARWRGNSFARDLDALLALLAVPGLGFVKGGFAVQLILGGAGCIDTQNLQRFGLRPGQVAARKTRRGALLHRAARYLSLCEKLGGPEQLWNSWCRHMAQLYPDTLSSAAKVSAMHWQIIENAAPGDDIPF